MCRLSLPMPMPASKPAASDLPNPRHANRVPAPLGPEQIRRIRQAAYNLPQVVRPADFGLDDASDADQELDHRGLILLQKAAAGARPSRWIAPALMESALRHLDVVGNGPAVRAAMAERGAALEALGVSREGGDWQRLVTQTLPLSHAGWRIAVGFRVPLEAEAVWAFYRDGDKAALVAALGAVPSYPDAAALTSHLDALIARSVGADRRHADSLLPRLQAECATPRRLDELKAACTRAQERWEQRVAELNTLDGLNSELAFQGYPDSFPTARQLQRSVQLFVGPPNSGKTHAAFERLAAAHDGAYLAPLRLLALEGRDRLVARGVACSLLTGEENVPAADAQVVSSTIEMVDTQSPIDLAVIDEAQMIFDPYRGWAWTQAIVGVPANELIVICSAYAVPAIETLLGLCGERCTVRHFERKQHVELLAHPVPIESLKKGDAVVAFSRRDVLMMRDQIGAGGHAVSVIYGALPPEVRRREAERFAQGESQVLVATDAIGMGLNLPIRRVLFSTLTKFDGQEDRPLDESEVHQIAGRAGRFGLHEEGFAGVLKEAEPTALRTLKDRLAKTPRAPRDFKAPVAPNWRHVGTISRRLHMDRLRDVLGVFMDQLKLDDAHFQVAELEQMLELAEQLDRAAGSLGLKERFIYAQAPVDTRTESQVQEYLAWAGSHALTGKAGTPWFLDQVDSHSRLDRMEQALRSCTLWLWLDLRFPGVYGRVDEVVDLRSQLNDGIERQLKSKKPLWQMRQARGRSR
jgi:ATP-dependent RNA helicase SUPV3L1/SUV3